jgi:uncharacterized damage-inducible protein DinB
MTSGRLVAAAIVFGVLASGQISHAQTPAAKPDPVLRDVLLEQWTDVGQKIIKMAEDFPAEKYEFRATKDVRTFADVLRHVAFWNGYVQKVARGEKADAKPNELPKAEYATKDKIVAALKQSFTDATAELKKANPSPSPKLAGLFVTFTEHSAEHYGQLVVYYRLSGLVPPASRGGN